jgi:tetratricopeptide (TPR) repeat protein
MINKVLSGLLAIALSLYVLIPLFAETVVLKSGQTLTGKLISRTANSITIEVLGQPATFYFDEIESIDNNKIVSSSESPEVVEKTVRSFLPKDTVLMKKDDLCKRYIASGQNYLQAEKYDQAIEQFTKAINLEPKFAQSYYNRALAYVKLATSLGRQDNTESLNQAVKDCTKAIELDPNYAESYNTRSLVYYLLWKQKYDAGFLNNAWADVHKLQELKATPDPKFIEELKQASAGEKSK